jgi:hypothetical protein
MEQVATNPALRIKFGTAGRARAESLFTFGVTTAMLAQRFTEVPAAAKAAPRLLVPALYVFHEWKGEALLPHTPSLEAGVRWLAEQACGRPDPASLERMEVLPDASVVESIWLRRAAARAKLEEVRGDLCEAVDGATFYQAARNAVYLAETFARRGTRVVHATRSDAVLTVWLLKRLHPELRVAAAVEEEPSLPRGLLARLLPDFDLLSVSDEKVRTSLPRKAEDVLKLKLPFVRREYKLGPLRLKRRKPAAKVNRAAAEVAWLAALRKL